MPETPDRIVKQVVLKAPLERVWRAITDAKQFGSWFGVEFDGSFVAGGRLTGRIVPTIVDANIAKAQEPYRGFPFEFIVDRIEPMRLFSFKWHPYAIQPGVDYSKEMPTLVEFELAEVPGGTSLTITESGFDRIPLERRAKAFKANEGGWTAQAGLIEKYLATHTAA